MKKRKLFFLIIVLCLGCVITSCTIAEPKSETPTIVNTPQEREATTTFQENQIRLADGMVMVFVPGGKFQMGSTKSEIEAAIGLCQEHYPICNRWYYERESPAHSVTLDDFWIDQTEISNAQYRLCGDAGICNESTTCKKGAPTFDDPNKANHPVVCVNWEEAQQYCEWAGTRLPSEAEWEYAFRGEERLIYPWGNEFDGARLNYCDANCSQSHTDDRFDDGYLLTAPVGSYPSGASWVDVLNMSGNVSEWVEDWYGEYPAEAVSNPSGPDTGDERMLKGCSWFSHPTYCRGAARPSVDLNTRFDYLGFRCASSDPSKPSTTPEKVNTQGFLIPDGKSGDIWNGLINNIPMVFVPEGTFMMGSNEPNASSDEKPQHEVKLDRFWIDQTEITNAQYNLCVDSGECTQSRYASNSAYNGENYPAVGVSWQDAADFCAWTGGRLQTEAEWEYAAKGPEGYQYPWGNTFDGNNLNYCDKNCTEDWADSNFDDEYHESAPVGSYPRGASWVGALDMAGNVWEWTWDWCASYSSDPQINPTGPENGNCKIIRGGAWASPQFGVRTTYRMINSEIALNIKHPNIGFRCVMPVETN